MSEILLQIDGKEVSAREGMTLLEAARGAGISIPTLCHHEKLEPYGGCRLCIVEVEKRGRTTLVVSCVYPVEGDLVVRTRSEKIDRIRKTLLELFLAHAPDAFELQDLAKEYGADKDRFEKNLHSVSIVGCVSDIVPRSNRNSRLDLLAGEQKRDQFHSGNRRQGVLGLQGMLPPLPHGGVAGSVCFDPGAIFLKTHVIKNT